MTEEQIALARRAVACRGWRWMPGMRVLGGGRITEHTLAIDQGCLPDLCDPATLGCLLAIVREAWNDPHASAWYDDEYWKSGNRWSWFAKDQSRVDYDSEAEALVAALESAPCW